MWNQIRNENDIQEFMNTHYCFHDSCIKELKYLSGAYIKDKWMHPINDKRILRIIIHGQYDEHSVIEMEFGGLKRLNLSPDDEKYSCDIFGVTMLMKDDLIYWCDDDNLTIDNIDDYRGTLICASVLKWRYVDEYIGDDEIYIRA